MTLKHTDSDLSALRQERDELLTQIQESRSRWERARELALAKGREEAAQWHEQRAAVHARDAKWMGRNREYFEGARIPGVDMAPMNGPAISYDREMADAKAIRALSPSSPGEPAGSGWQPIARPMTEWHDDAGDVLWWKFPIDEPPYCGSPLCSDWPGYHTHWTPLILPAPPHEPTGET